MKRAIRLPNGYRVSLGTYVQAWRALLLAPPDMLVRGFDHFDQPAASILRELRYGMHDRINQHVPGHGRGRKWDSDWQRAAIQCAHRVNTPRLIVRQVPRDFQSRLAHRLWTED